MVFELTNPEGIWTSTTPTGVTALDPAAAVSPDTVGNVNDTTTFGRNLSECHGTGCGVLLGDLALQPPWIAEYNKDRLFLPALILGSERELRQ